MKRQDCFDSTKVLAIHTIVLVASHHNTNSKMRFNTILQYLNIGTSATKVMPSCSWAFVPPERLATHEI